MPVKVCVWMCVLLVAHILARSAIRLLGTYIDVGRGEDEVEGPFARVAEVRGLHAALADLEAPVRGWQQSGWQSGQTKAPKCARVKRAV